MHHKCEGKYLVVVSSGGGSVTSAAPLLAAPATSSSGSVGVALRQRHAPSTYHSVSVSYESLYSTLFTRLSGAHLYVMDMMISSTVNKENRHRLGKY